MILTVTTFLGATLAVALATFLIVKRMKHSSDAIEDFFIGGRSLSWPIVAGSLLLTNLSTEQLVGLNGAVFKDGNLVGIAWEALAAFAMIATALLFLPRYLSSGFTTTPGFLAVRYDESTKKLVSGLFLFGYVTVLLPVVLYTGSLALKTMFDLDLPLWSIVIGIGTLGSLYAIFGGLRSVAVSDTMNGIGLLIGGLAIPMMALSSLGDGSIGEGLSILISDRPESLTPLAMENKSGEAASVPWTTLLSGMMFIQIFYWSTNQVIVQRAMAAKSLAHGQKGVLFAAAMKLVGPVMLCLPGIIALHMTDSLNIKADDEVYPAIVRHVLPNWSLGLFGAVLVGSILSSFNSALNSASTLFCLDFYVPIVEKGSNTKVEAARCVKVGQIFATCLAVTAMIVAPLLAQMDSIFAYLQKINGLYSVPIIAIFLVGVLNKTAPAIGAKWAMAVGILLYGFFTFFGPFDVFCQASDIELFGLLDLLRPIASIHWLHGYFISTLMAIAVLLYFAKVAPRVIDDVNSASAPKSAPVSVEPWQFAKPAAVAIVVVTVVMYVGLLSLSQ
ncbi:MAG: SSS family solute:Na+ symporter [Planctomycetota bacterium]|jgi:SSS family solute:Na+ symporter